MPNKKHIYLDTYVVGFPCVGSVYVGKSNTNKYLTNKRFIALNTYQSIMVDWLAHKKSLDKYTY